jgi:hypothetical protein
MRYETRRQIYLLGSLWNFGFALSGLALPRMTLWLISGSTKTLAGVLARTFFFFFWVAVGVFGIGYYLVSRDPDRNEAVIWTGCLAKVIIFVTLSRLYLRRQVKLFAFLGGLGDFIWTFLFLAAQKREKRLQAGLKRNA